MADPAHQKPKHDHPEGMEPYDLGGENDLGALSKEQQEKLNKFKVKRYLLDERFTIKTYKNHNVPDFPSVNWRAGLGQFIFTVESFYFNKHEHGIVDGFEKFEIFCTQFFKSNH